MRQHGQLRTCDRCGATIFLKTTGEGETDGGYTRWNKFEDAKGWTNPYEIGDLCPNCSEEWDILRAEFKRRTKDFKTGEAAK